VQERGPKLRIKPHSPNITYREVGARQVKAHWHRASRNGNGRSQLAAPIE
jgi:hypothetical protein